MHAGNLMFRYVEGSGAFLFLAQSAREQLQFPFLLALEVRSGELFSIAAHRKGLKPCIYADGSIGRSNIINNKQEASANTLKVIADGLGVAFWELFESREDIINQDKTHITCPKCGARFKLEE